MFRRVSQEALIALELFRLSPRSKKGRPLIEQHLVEVSMYLHPEARSVKEIVEALSDLLEQPSVLGEVECQKALAKCCRINRIKQVPPDEYTLSDPVKDELQKRHEEFREAEVVFNNGLIDSVGRALDTIVNPIAEPLLCGIVRDVIQETFYTSAIRLQSLLSSKGDVFSTMHRDFDIHTELRDKLRPFMAVQKRGTLDQVVEGIRLFLGRLDSLQRRYIANLHRRVFYFQILNIDPRLHAIEKESFTNTRIYLDTNVAIRYVCDGAELHQPIVDVLNGSVFLGVKLFISPITLKEAQGLVNEALALSSYLKDGRIAKILQASPTAVNNPIIDGFIRQRRVQRELNWDAYVSPMRNLEEYLFSYSVIVEKEDFEDIENDKAYQEVY
ncbi:hypothetical protein KA005_24905, partial [bacterium]|nr:hypothetical protein [bacterium]